MDYKIIAFASCVCWQNLGEENAISVLQNNFHKCIYCWWKMMDWRLKRGK